MMVNCIVCKKSADHILCYDCNPQYGQNLKAGNLSIYIGEISFFSAFRDRLNGRNVVKWWVGTDALKMIMFPPGKNFFKVLLYRIKTWAVLPLININWYQAETLLEEYPLKNAKVVWWPGYFGKVKKKKHKGFNVLYYDPNVTEKLVKYSRWKYGIDIIEKLKNEFPHLNWIRADGTQDMNEIYPIVDLYVRPSRHDARPRMVEECKFNKIRHLYSSNHKPVLGDFVDSIKDVAKQEVSQ